jgi:hypothetical protein
MTVAEILEQAHTLSAEERKELVKLLIAPATPAKTGAEIVAMLEAMEPIEFVDAHLTDPVEWVKAQRRKLVL